MQKQIDTILQGKDNKKTKILKLQSLFQQGNFVFSDFDDTITQTFHLFYSKNKYLSATEDKRGKRLKNFSINPRFLTFIRTEKMSKIVIISRGKYEFLKYFMQYTKTLFQEEHCEIIGVVGKTDDFQFTSSEKMEIIPKDKILITDIFEYHTLHNYPNVKFLEPYSIGKKWGLYCLKAFYFIKYLIGG